MAEPRCEVRKLVLQSLFVFKEYFVHIYGIQHNVIKYMYVVEGLV
jgi:hypothetical protein